MWSPISSPDPCTGGMSVGPGLPGPGGFGRVRSSLSVSLPFPDPCAGGIGGPGGSGFVWSSSDPCVGGPGGSTVPAGGSGGPAGLSGGSGGSAGPPGGPGGSPGPPGGPWSGGLGSVTWTKVTTAMSSKR